MQNNLKLQRSRYLPKKENNYVLDAIPFEILNEQISPASVELTMLDEPEGKFVK